MNFFHLNQVLKIWYDAKEKTIACWENILHHNDEGVEFSHRDRTRSDHEMSSFQTFYGNDIKAKAQNDFETELGEHGIDKISESEDVEFNEYCGETQISEWQAGWNVTNAIQVS